MSADAGEMVVVVRCPLCGGWIIGNDYSRHVEDVHLSALPGALVVQLPSPGSQAPGPDSEPAERLLTANQICSACWVEAAGQLTAGAARELLWELDARRRHGQDVCLAIRVIV
jgi:hypothetical protein